MKLIFLYVSEGDAPGMTFDESQVATNRFTANFHTEGLDSIFKSLLANGVIDECLLVVESSRGTGTIEYQKNYKAIVVPELSHIEKYIDDDTQIFVRGGFRSWYPFLEKMTTQGRWMWLYAANTGRGRWPFWDIIFNDTGGKNSIDSLGRVTLEYRKPINQTYFHYQPCAVKYDIMIGASRVHDKKGQWKVVNAVKAIKDMYGVNLKCILPGPMARGTRTNEIVSVIAKNNLSIELPGILDREVLAAKMRQSIIMIHAGASGENDRGPLEAMACGCSLMIASPQYHASFLYDDEAFSSVLSYPDDAEKLGKEIYDYVSRKREAQDIQYDKTMVANYYRGKNDNSLIVDDFSKLINFMKENPKRDIGALMETYEIS